MTDEELSVSDATLDALDEVYDTMMEVQRNPTGAWQAIQDQASAITTLRECEARLRAQLAEARAERDTARQWLGAANNEFGSAAWDWPDLWRRIAELKELSNERWQRADRAEAALAALDRMLAEARNNALREAAELIRRAQTIAWNGMDLDTAKRAANSIIALIDKKENQK